MKSILPLPVADVAVVPGPHPDWMLAVKRHTDNIGAATQNLDVSRLRAEAVKRALVEQYQVDGTRLKTDGHGASQPKDTNATVEGRGRAIGAPSS